MKIVRFLYHLIVLFGFVVEFPLMSGLTTRRFAALIAILTLVLRKEKTKEVLTCVNWSRFKYAMIFFSICLFITLFHSMFPQIDAVFSEGGYTKAMEFHFYFYIILYIFIFSLFCVVDFESIKDFSSTWICFMLIESLAIYYAAVNYSVRLFFYTYFYTGDDRFSTTIEYGSRIVGIGIHSSIGSVIMSTACILLVFLRLKDQIKQILFVVCYIIIVVATAFIARTGLIIEIVVLLYYGILSGKTKDIAFNLILPAILSVVGITYILSTIDAAVADKLGEWILGAVDKEYAGAVLERAKGSGSLMDENALLGIGILRGRYGIQDFHTDSGYIMIYTAIGAVGLICYYLAMLFLLLSPKLPHTPIIRYFYIGILLIPFIIEYKEPYFLNYIFAWFMVTMMLFNAKDTLDSRKPVLIIRKQKLKPL